MPDAEAGQAPPRVAVVGLWHLGSVTAACVASADWPVLAIDPDLATVARLAQGRPPLLEPGLPELIAGKQREGCLHFAARGDPALTAAEIVWITFDTPVDAEDRADVGWVLDRSAELLVDAGADALVIVSSQLPVGSVATLAERMRKAGRGDLRFACVPENLRLGRAIEIFTSSPDRVVAGVGSERDRAQLSPLLQRFSDRIEWMSVESAEMTKHALNAFLATSVAFINEIAAICERVGADAADVSRGLKTEQRIGPRAYLSPGDAFAGGTLARDIDFLTRLAGDHGVPAEVAAGVAASNEAHRGWAQRTLQATFAGAPQGLAGRRIAIWGLTYKPQTSTLRRSSAVELARSLISAGASVTAYDPAIAALPDDLHLELALATSPLEAVRGADALVVSTGWPELREVPAEDVAQAMRTPLVLDAAGHVKETLGALQGARYLRVGSPLA